MMTRKVLLLFAVLFFVCSCKHIQFSAAAIDYDGGIEVDTDVNGMYDDDNLDIVYEIIADNTEYSNSNTAPRETIEGRVKLVDDYEKVEEKEEEKDESYTPEQIEEQKRIRQFLDTSAFDLIKNQVISDINAFMLLIPPPVKAYVRSAATNILHRSKIVLLGFYGPMLSVLGRNINILGDKLLAMSDKVDRSIRQKVESKVSVNAAKKNSSKGNDVLVDDDEYGDVIEL